MIVYKILVTQHDDDGFDKDEDDDYHNVCMISMLLSTDGGEMRK